VAQSGTEWHRVAQSGTEWHRVAQSGTECRPRKLSLLDSTQARTKNEK
jgi:hypothetical protein